VLRGCSRLPVFSGDWMVGRLGKGGGNDGVLVRSISLDRGMGDSACR